MPAISAFGRKWLVGSDDFVFPALVDLTVKLCWLIGALVVFIRNDPYFGCPHGDHFKIYLYGLISMLLMLILTDGLVLKNSMTGGILDEDARVRVVPFIYIRCFFELLDIFWNILGTAWAYGDPFMLGCPEEPEALSFMKRFTVCNWLSTLVMFLFFVALWDPLGYDASSQPNEKKKVADPLSLPSYYTTESRPQSPPHTEHALYWTAKLKKLMCFSCNPSKDDNVLGAFEEAGRILSFLCRDSNLVTTDVLAGLLALYVRTMNEEEARNEAIRKRNKLTGSGAGQAGPVACVCQNNIIYPITSQPKILQQESADVFACKNEIVMLDHYLRFIHGCYDWKTFLVKNLKKNGISRLWSSIECCSCFRSQRSNEDMIIKGDNCCLCNTASIRNTSRIDSRDIKYICIENGYFESPFCVIRDPSTKSIVVVIRGCLNTKDMLSSLMGPISLEIPGLPLHFKANHWAIVSARILKEKLEKDRVLLRLFDKYPDYRLVLVGQSSGAATATVLSFLLFYEFPSLHCFCYSPPGNVLNKDAAEFSKSFITSVTHGDDLFARLSIQSVSVFKSRLRHAIQSCQTPKYKLLLGYMKLFKNKGPLPQFEYFDNIPEIVVDEDTNENNNKDYSSYNSASNTSVRAESNNNSNFGSSNHKNKLENSPFYTPMFVPGRILHVTQRDSWLEQPEAGPRWHLKWADKRDFQDIAISPRMLADHWHHRMEKGLHEFVITNCKEAFNALHHNRQWSDPNGRETEDAERTTTTE